MADLFTGDLNSYCDSYCEGSRLGLCETIDIDQIYEGDEVVNEGKKML